MDDTQRKARAGPSKVANVPSPVVLHEPTLKTLQLDIDQRVVIVQKLSPSSIPELAGSLGRTNDVSEHDCRQDSVALRTAALASDELLNESQRAFGILEER